MYYVYLDKMLLPVSPSKIETSVGSNNKVYDLVNEGEFTVIKSAPLQEIKFEFLIPLHQQPFAHYKSGFIGANVFLEYIKSIKENKEPIQLIITRESSKMGAVIGGVSVLAGVLGVTGSIGAFTNLKVTLEDYSIDESAENNGDFLISATFREYKADTLAMTSVGAVISGVTGAVMAGISAVTRSTKDSPAPKNTVKQYTVKKGDTLWAISKKFYGDGSKYTVISKYNHIENPNKIEVGQKLTIPKV